MKLGTAIVLSISVGLLAGCRDQSPTSLDAHRGVRIVSLAPSLTEIFAAIGASHTLVGRTSACDYPPDVVREVRVVGGFGQPSLENLIAVRPSAVVDVDLEDESIIRRLAELGIRHVRIPCNTLDDIGPAIRTAGRLGRQEVTAESIATELELKLAALRKQSAAITNRPSVYIEIWHDPMMTSGRAAYLTEIIELAGGRNIAAAVEKEYFQVSPEWVLSRNPQVVICTYMSQQSTIPEMLAQRPGWGELAAVQNGHVFVGLDNNVILRPGPRVVEAIEVLRSCIAQAQTP